MSSAKEATASAREQHVLDYHVKTGVVDGKLTISVIYGKGGCTLNGDCPLAADLNVSSCPHWPCGGLGG